MKVFLVLFLFILNSMFSLVMAQQPPTPVFVTVVSKVDFVDEVEALGTLQANENVNLTSTVTERITKINFEDNQQVKRGEVLIEMDAAQEEAELAEEQSRTDEAQRQVERLRPLVERGAAANSVLDTQERELNTARARIKAIQSRINERRVTAPFDGVVGIRNISIGSLAQPGTLITTIDDIAVMKLDFSVPEVFLSSLERGITIEARASAYPQEVFRGTVTSIDSRVDPNTRSVFARALLDNEQGLLKAGMLMRIKLNKNPRQALVIPEEALMISGSQSYVMLVREEGGKTIVQRQPVELGTRREGESEILSGLQEGEQIVIHGNLRIRPGAEVVVKAVERNNESLSELLQQSSKGDEQ